MPRLNIYIPDELDLAIRNHPGEMNISQVCADALRAELNARGTDRSIEGLFHALTENPNELERELMRKFRLRRALVGFATDASAHDTIGYWASSFLDSDAFCEGLHVGLGGGRQMWEVARRLEPRNLGMNVWALGFGDVDRERPHLHPNALVTLVSMMYGTRTKPMLVGAPHFKVTWSYPAVFPTGETNVQRLIVGSCAMFDAESPYARLLGKEITDLLVEEHVMGDFLGVFITGDGRIVQPYLPSMTVSHVAAADLQLFTKRDDAMVLLAAGGGDKVRLIRSVFELGLCNAFITDNATALALV